MQWPPPTGPPAAAGDGRRTSLPGPVALLPDGEPVRIQLPFSVCRLRRMLNSSSGSGMSTNGLPCRCTAQPANHFCSPQNHNENSKKNFRDREYGSAASCKVSSSDSSGRERNKRDKCATVQGVLFEIPTNPLPQLRSKLTIQFSTKDSTKTL